MNRQITIGDLKFDVRRSASRRSFGITVDRDGSLALALPRNYSRKQVEQAVDRRKIWIYTKLAEKALLLPPPARKKYAAGETFHYLGRGFRLSILRGRGQGELPLRLERGRFCLPRQKQSHAAIHFAGWYLAHGQPWLEDRVSNYSDRVRAYPKSVQVQDIGYRWGSCTPGGKIRFHWRIIQLPPRIIDYIIAHELVHFHYPHHTKQFWQTLESHMPDYEARRRWLAVNGGRF